MLKKYNNELKNLNVFRIFSIIKIRNNSEKFINTLDIKTSETDTSIFFEELISSGSLL